MVAFVNKTACIKITEEDKDITIAFDGVFSRHSMFVVALATLGYLYQIELSPAIKALYEELQRIAKTEAPSLDAAATLQALH